MNTRSPHPDPHILGFTTKPMITVVKPGLSDETWDNDQETWYMSVKPKPGLCAIYIYIYINIYINKYIYHDPGMTLTYFTARST